MNPFKKRLQPFFEGEGAGGGSGTGGAGSGEGAGGGSGAGGSGGAGGDAGRVTFTAEQQAALDKIIADRVARAEKSAGKRAQEARAKELGFDSVEAMEAAVKAHQDAQAKNKTDLEKAQEAQRAAEAQAKAAGDRAKTALIRAAFAEAAIAANLVSADDAFRLADLSKVTVSDDGAVEGVKEAVEQLAKDKPYLVKQAGGQGGAGGGGNPARGGGGSQDDDAERGRQMAAARNRQAAATGANPWAPQGAGAVNPDQLAQAVAAAVAAALKPTA